MTFSNWCPEFLSISIVSSCCYLLWGILSSYDQWLQLEFGWEGFSVLCCASFCRQVMQSCVPTSMYENKHQQRATQLHLGCQKVVCQSCCLILLSRQSGTWKSRLAQKNKIWFNWMVNFNFNWLHLIWSYHIYLIFFLIPHTKSYNSVQIWIVWYIWTFFDSM